MAILSDINVRYNGHSNRKFYVDILAIAFGISSWISINGLWVELPLLVEQLPESWSLASYLSIIVQFANLGPLTIGLLRWICHEKIPIAWIIVGLLLMGSASSSLLVSFWDRTSVFGGQDHSTALFVLVFFLSLVDCTSSVLFLPFMGVFKEIYLNSYLVGEGLSGFIPSLAALAQGVGGNPYCDNVTYIDGNGTFISNETVKVVPAPRFSVDIFFGFLTCMMVISLFAFLLLNFWPGCTEEHAENRLMVATHDELENQRSQSPSPSTKSIENGNLNMSKRPIFLLLLIQSFVCFISNGAFPSIQTYSCLPYGNLVYHLSVTLNAMVNPAMAFFSFFVPCTKLKSILALTGVGTLLSFFLLATALTSPGMLGGQSIGGTFTVLSWIIYGGLFSYVKISIAGICRQTSNSALFWCGAVTQIGSAFGALLMFILVNVASGIFTAYYVTCE